MERSAMHSVCGESLSVVEKSGQRYVNFINVSCSL